MEGYMGMYQFGKKYARYSVIDQFILASIFLTNEHSIFVLVGKKDLNLQVRSINVSIFLFLEGI